MRTLTDRLFELYPDEVYQYAMNLSPSLHAMIVEDMEEYYQENPEPDTGFPVDIAYGDYETELCRDYHARLIDVIEKVFAIRAGNGLLAKTASLLDELESWTHVSHALHVCDGLDLTAGELRDLMEKESKAKPTGED